MNQLPTVPCTYCGAPTTYTGTKHCDPCHAATHAPIDTLRKIIREHEAEEFRRIVREELERAGCGRKPWQSGRMGPG